MRELDYAALATDIKRWGKELGFADVKISDVDLSQYEAEFLTWLEKGYHGDMEYMANHGLMRCRPNELVPGTLSVICVRMDYLPPDAQFATTLKDANAAYISRYALGRDYHKVLRNKLKQLAEQISRHVGEFGFRPFVDSAPVMERQLAEKAGLGWTGKHSLNLSAQAGSWYFLGELFTDLPLPRDTPVSEQCGKCTACLTICPTQAIVEPYVVDARRCISYLTIELKGAIPETLRPLIGNRIYGCDDCQLVCPWNRYAQLTEQADFNRRPIFRNASLLNLFSWDEATFLKHTEGSAIRRIGHERWLRNIAVALGNGPASQAVLDALAERLNYSPLVAEHCQWAITQLQAKLQEVNAQLQDRKTLRLVSSIEKGLARDA